MNVHLAIVYSFLETTNPIVSSKLVSISGKPIERQQVRAEIL